MCLCESSVESSSIDLVGMALRTFIDLGVSDSIHPDLLYIPPHTHTTTEAVNKSPRPDKLRTVKCNKL